MSRSTAIRVIHTTGLSPQEIEAILTAHDSALASGDGVLKDQPRTAVTRVRGDAGWVCVKEYRRKGMVDKAKEVLRGSRAERAWEGALRLAADGIAAPEPLAVAERGHAAYLLTRYVEEALPLHRMLADRFGGHVSAEEAQAKRTLIEELARWLRRAHDAGVYHDDWSAKNILVAEAAGKWAFYLLDFESISPFKPLTRRRRIKNLAQLSDIPRGASRTDKMRFLIAYARGDESLLRGRFPTAVLALARHRVLARERHR